VLQPAVAYGYFAVNAAGDDLIVWKDDTRASEWLRFTFPANRRTRGFRWPISSAQKTAASRTTRRSMW